MRSSSLGHERAYEQIMCSKQKAKIICLTLPTIKENIGVAISPVGWASKTDEFNST